ncbi:MAG TPA: hypothetical protein VN888_06240 [Mycobacterium sp.]|nr:hypothetical protein [Mycobacterium sp.]
MTTTYTVPDNPTDPEAAALELIVRLPEDILHTAALRPVLRRPLVDDPHSRRGWAYPGASTQRGRLHGAGLPRARHPHSNRQDRSTRVLGRGSPLGDIASGAQRIVHDRIAAAEASTKAQEDAAEYARELVAAKVPIRDVADLLGLSFQRVSQPVTPRVD